MKIIISITFLESGPGLIIDTNSNIHTVGKGMGGGDDRTPVF